MEYLGEMIRTVGRTSQGLQDPAAGVHSRNIANESSDTGDSILCYYTAPCNWTFSTLKHHELIRSNSSVNAQPLSRFNILVLLCFRLETWPRRHWTLSFEVENQTSLKHMTPHHSELKSRVSQQCQFPGMASLQHLRW